MHSSKLVALALGAAVAGSAAAAFAAPTQQLTGHQLMTQATVSLKQARSIALRAAHGTIVSQQIEREAGGSGLRYTFSVKTAAGMREIGIDAKTGTVLGNVAEKAAEKGESGESGSEKDAGG